MTAPARLWFGTTSHVREKPFRRSFRHRIAMLDLDIDRFAEANRLSPLLSVGKGNAVSFRETDFGACSPSVPLRGWAEARFAEAGICLEGGMIRLITFPRVFGYGFAPISIWHGHGRDGDLRGVIYEVHNTFGETHSYVTAYGGGDVREKAKKAFHVSPFFDVNGEYRFTLQHADDRIGLTVESISVDGRHHVASLSVRPTAVTTGTILKWLITMPISGLGVMIAIHWQALGLLLKGARYRDKPEQRPVRVTLTQPEETATRAADELRKRA